MEELKELKAKITKEAAMMGAILEAAGADEAVTGRIECAYLFAASSLFTIMAEAQRNGIRGPEDLDKAARRILMQAREELARVTS